MFWASIITQDRGIVEYWEQIEASTYNEAYKKLKGTLRKEIHEWPTNKRWVFIEAIKIFEIVDNAFIYRASIDIVEFNKQLYEDLQLLENSSPQKYNRQKYQQFKEILETRIRDNSYNEIFTVEATSGDTWWIVTEEDENGKKSLSITGGRDDYESIGIYNQRQLNLFIQSLKKHIELLGWKYE